MAEKVCGVYFIKNTVNGKWYVGSSVDINRRLKGHFNNLRKGKHVNHLLQNDWISFGEAAFSSGILDVASEADLIKVEQAWIDRLADYNLAPAAGSTLGFKQSDEFKAKRREMTLGENNPMFGKKRPEVGDRMRAIHTGRKLSEEHKAKCAEALKGKGVGKVITQAQREAISRANKGRKRTPEQLIKMSEAQKNRKPISEETREKLRVASTGRRHSEETKIKIGLAMRK